MKNWWIWAIILVAVLGIGYAYKHQIKLLLTGSGSSSPATSLYGTSPVTTSTAPTSVGVVTTKTGPKGNFLAGPNGMTLYTFDKDTANVSSCSGACATNWPAYVTASAPTTLPAGIGTFTRPDGQVQFTFNKMPLYYYSGDSAPGDTNGDGFGGVWHIVKQ